MKKLKILTKIVDATNSVGGKLHIVISTKDGPTVHSVKESSSLEGEIYPGDLTISPFCIVIKIKKVKRRICSPSTRKSNDNK